MGENVSVIKLTLHGRLVGYLAGFQSGRNILTFLDEFRGDSRRPTFSLTTHPKFPLSSKLMSEPWTRNQRLHPTLSNLLPEGSLRELIAQGLKVHQDNEFQIFSYLGQDLPGAIVASPLSPGEVPDSVLEALNGRSYKDLNLVGFQKLSPENKFSLAGVQMKFSMKAKDGRYNLSTADALGDWIIKTPSTKHKDVPLNEYTAMALATLVGVEIPEIQLVELDKLDNLPPINLPDERYAFAIKRFDREAISLSESVSRIHMEDFAQVLVKYPHEKYDSANYEQIGRILYQFSGDPLADTQQFARRLLVNILLANGDAHLKNWSLLYTDQVTPRLSPAYDILTTSVYIEGERNFALNLGKTKDWYQVSYMNFQAWAEKSGIPWRAIKPHLADVMDRARSQWTPALKNLPMNEKHKAHLIEHWRSLHPDFRI
ncbi:MULTISPECIES: type II toxin-antitoxin system HipA family toxin [unclassified Marinobacterium]|jgi:serine/threonine-protein kinase HipA|uniref:type II toxin-antitoxin system HipA family toxin n=1 Tax=unclassified Marinobacterium TaxID=2644139 RepID=UPI001567E1AD|nr:MULTISPECIES: type II toxin-antitoxin system HipA family toxin [unclassified Marinobacterium]NRP09091.1 Serine/threonine-protein kinase HipA [Marinobacterium sp. xm-g-48]NRP27968.1 Serine/threonine-protein kinase HipA [Marinobacterium sp. xm-d-420]NRP39615.1 Serine/threonine-protein kinase HipA [Marinobacterium sp. xm-a-121]NRP53512.1 Serine/threonine-protein kinase HipA [Marinobacterium sp. xm-v-242]NRP56773.1 Serine/threonine-protein kinase HipA [Marinobacterium sp. xm-d-510]